MLIFSNYIYIFFSEEHWVHFILTFLFYSESKISQKKYAFLLAGGYPSPVWATMSLGHLYTTVRFVFF